MLAKLPNIVNGYELNPGRSWFSVIKPKAATNLIPNPDWERGLQGWTSDGLKYQCDPTNPASGAYSARVTSDTPVRLRLQSGSWYSAFDAEYPIPTVAGKTYTLSFKYRTNLATTDTLRVRMTGSISGTLVEASIPYVVDGVRSAVIPQTSGWKRVSYTWREVTTQNRAVNIETVGASTQGDMWLDDVQLEEGVEATTLISGDIGGAGVEDGDYYWTSVPGESSSVRTANCVSGGEVINFSALGFRVIGHTGLGLAGQTNIVQPSSTGGGYYSETIQNGSTFQIIGRFDANHPLSLSARRDAMIALLRHDRAGGQSRPVFLRYQMAVCDDLMTGAVDIPCLYEGGLEGQVDNLYAEDVVITFNHYDRALIAKRKAGSPLANTSSTASGAGILYNKSTDTYTLLSITNISTLNVVRPASNGTFWLGGPFTDAGGVSTADYVCRWNPATGAVTGFGAGAVSGVGVDGIFVSKTGYVYVFGQFTQIGGVTSGNVARYNPVTGAFEVWGNTNGRVRGIVETPGRVWVYGDFTTVAGTACSGLAYTANNGTSWIAASVPAGTNSIRGAAYDRRSNRVYTVGTTSSIATAVYYDLAAGTYTLYASMTLTSALWVGCYLMPDGQIALVRSATSAAASGIYRVVNGSQIYAVAEYRSGYTSGINRCWQDTAGNVHISLVWTEDLGGVQSPAQYHWWDGQRVHPSPVMVGVASYYPVGFVDGFGPYELLVLQTAIYLSTPGLTTIANVGSTAPALLTLQGPGILMGIDNKTTGQSIEFNMTVRVGEVITIDTRTGRVTSSVSGTGLAGVLSQATISQWRLAPGSNRIRLRFWPRLNNGSDEYQPVTSGSANAPGTALLRNASLATTIGGVVHWQVTSGDVGTLALRSSLSPRVGSIPSGTGIVATTDLPIQLSGDIDLVPTPGPAAGYIWYPLAHIYYDDLLASIDGAVGRA